MTVRRTTSAWRFPVLSQLGAADDLVAVGADLEPETLLDAYEAGYFPMPLPRRRLGWFSPDPRGVLRPGELRMSRSLRRSVRRYSVTTNHHFRQVVTACADPTRPQGWIDTDITNAYERLHELGHAHSVEVWDGQELVGGLYGVSLGGLFAGESMFHRQTDASKVALVHLVDLLSSNSAWLLDVQWQTPHLASLGVQTIARVDYANELADAIGQPAPQFS